ncbi:ALA-interacting subunit 5-like isoform X2 [Phragmites australis]|nr:ALA-interacting subunit 5-like isoform X2 [Phragmites australis]
MVIPVLVFVGITSIPIGLACIAASTKTMYWKHRYVKSRSDAQLRNPKKVRDTRTCKPEATADGSPIVPCGLVALSLFNDTYSFTRGDETLTVSKQGISWRSEREHIFGKRVYPRNFQNVTLIGGGKLDPSKPLSKQEDLMVWMRAAALPAFRKLYGRIEADELITVTMRNNYNTYSFGGKKTLVLSTAGVLGGKNSFIGFSSTRNSNSSFLRREIECLFF